MLYTENGQPGPGQISGCRRGRAAGNPVIEDSPLGPCPVPRLPGVLGGQQDPAVPLDLHRVGAAAEISDPAARRRFQPFRLSHSQVRVDGLVTFENWGQPCGRGIDFAAFAAMSSNRRHVSAETAGIPFRKAPVRPPQRVVQRTRPPGSRSHLNRTCPLISRRSRRGRLPRSPWSHGPPVTFPLARPLLMSRRREDLRRPRRGAAPGRRRVA